MTLLIVFFLSSIIFSFLCSIWEAVLLSITPSYTNRKVQEGGSLGESLKYFKEDIDRPLSAILTLNTIAHTVGAIGVGAQASKVFASGSALDLGGFAISYESIVATLMTLAILILSEIIPKTIGANNWQSLAPFTVRSLNFVMMILKPFVWLSQLITRGLKKEEGKSVLSRADFVAMANVGESEGSIQTAESNVIKNILTLEKLKVEDIMTPRIVVNQARENLTLREFYDSNELMRYSRIPLYADETGHKITGIVLKHDILSGLVEGNDDTLLSEIKREVDIIKENALVSELFHEKAGEGSHLTIVVDDYGSVTGLVTMEDVIESILGIEIVDEMDAVADLREIAQKKWKERAKDMGIEP